MSPVLGIIVTLILVALMLWGVMKKMNAGFLLMIIGLVAIFAMELITGTSVMGEKSTGNLFFDLFEYFGTTAASQLSRNVLIVMTVMGYVYYMEKLKASTMFALLLSKPFKKLKNPYMIIVMVLVFGAILKLGITSASSLTAMLLATVYPVMRQVGLTRNTAASCLPIAGSIVWGPADANWVLAFGLAGLDVEKLPEFFVKYEILYVAILLVCLGITLPLFSKYFDKKEGEEANANDVFNAKDVGDPDSLGIPKFYALFPLLPLVVILIFSSLIKATPNISIIAAHIMCFVFVMIIDLIVNAVSKKAGFLEVFNRAGSYFEGMGRYFNLGGIIMISAAILTQGLTMVGGITSISKLLTEGNAGFVIGIAAATLIGMFIAAFSHLSPVISIFTPVVAAICAAKGVGVEFPLCALIFGSCMGLNVYATNSAIIIASGATGAPISTILKRNLIPSIITAVVCIIVGVIFA